MEKAVINESEYFTIDLLQILKAFWTKAWAIALAGILAGAAGFSLASFVIPPKYSSSILLYVNNSTFSLANTSFSISASDISASQSLVKTYTELLKNRTTLERVIDKTGVDYTYSELYDMVSAGSSNNTEIMKVTVTSTNPNEAAKIANCIAQVLPDRIAEIIDGASMEIVDSAIANKQKVSPSITKFTALGLMLGVCFACLIIAIKTISDDRIHSEEYLIQNYNYPILAKVPNLLGSDSKKYSYHYYQSNGRKTAYR